MIPTQEIKKIKKEEKEGTGHQSDGEKSDQDLVVDDACSEDIINPMSPMPPNQANQHPHHHHHHHHNGSAATSPPRENGMIVKKVDHLNERNIVTPNSPRSSSSDRGSSSNGSTTPSNSKIKLEEKPSTPGTPGINGSSGIPKSVVAKPPAGYPPGYLGPLNGGNPHEMQAAYAAAAAGVPVLPPGHPGYRGVPTLPIGFDAHPQMRAPIGPGALSMTGGKP
jgi:groucho